MPSASASAVLRSASLAIRKSAPRPARRAQDREAERMKAVDSHRPRLLAEKPREPCSQFLGRLAREGDGEARPSRYVAFQNEMSDAVGEHACLARAGPGDHHQRSFRLRGVRLVGVEPGENAGATRRLRFNGLERHHRLVGRVLLRPALRCPHAAGERRVEQQPASGEAIQLAVLEQPDDAVFPVISGLPDNVTGAQPCHRLAEQRMHLGDVLHRQVLQRDEFRPKRGDGAVVGMGDGLRGDAAADDLRQDLRQRNEARHRAGRRRRHSLAAIGQCFDAVRHADRDRSPACRAAATQFDRLPWVEPHAAIAMPVHVILAFLGEELDRSDIAFTALQRPSDREIIGCAGKARRFAAEFAGRMRVGIGGETEAVERGNAPVHGRIGRQAGFDGEDVRGEVAIAFLDGIEA
jgi:hypothetical protein